VQERLRAAEHDGRDDEVQIVDQRRFAGLPDCDTPPRPAAGALLSRARRKADSIVRDNRIRFAAYIGIVAWGWCVRTPSYAPSKGH
jgi:hypothetical protein